MKVLIITKDNFYAIGIRKFISEFFINNYEILTTYVICQPMLGQHEEVIIGINPEDYFSSQDIAFKKERHVSIAIMERCSENKYDLMNRDFRVEKISNCCQVNEVLKSAMKLLLKKIVKVDENYLENNREDVIYLQKREKRLLELFGKGLSPNNISLVMKIDIKRVSAYKRSVMRKLNIKKSVDFYRYALNSAHSSAMTDVSQIHKFVTIK